MWGQDRDQCASYMGAGGRDLQIAGFRTSLPGLAARSRSSEQADQAKRGLGSVPTTT